MLNYFEEKSDLMNGAKIRWFVFYKKFLRKNQRDDGEEKMEKIKVWKEVNVELFSLVGRIIYINITLV